MSHECSYVISTQRELLFIHSVFDDDDEIIDGNVKKNVPLHVSFYASSCSANIIIQ